MQISNTLGVILITTKLSDEYEIRDFNHFFLRETNFHDEATDYDIFHIVNCDDYER